MNGFQGEGISKWKKDDSGVAGIVGVDASNAAVVLGSSFEGVNMTLGNLSQLSKFQRHAPSAGKLHR
jgi:hypothetical protein